MIHSIYGEVTFIGEEYLHLQVGAIEWSLLMSGQSLRNLHTGDSCKIYTYLHHKEDIMQLYGFKDAKERDLFFHLIKVDGIGPKAALKILSFFTPHTFQEALEAPDAKLLAKAPGLGTKTAQKVMLALKGKLDLTSDSSKNMLSTHNYDELLQPLIGMGFDRKLAMECLASVRKELGNEASESEILKKTITYLS